MTSMTTYRFRLLPSRKQEETFVQWLGTTRYLYNLFLEYRMTVYKTSGKTISKFDIQKELTELKGNHSWIAEVHSQTLQDVTDRFDKAYQNFFARVKKGQSKGFPKFKNRRTWDSFLFKQGVKDLGKEKKIFLPKIGHVRFKASQEIIGQVKTCSIVRERNAWFACVTCEREFLPLPTSQNMIGIDLGLKSLIATSDGNFVAHPKFGAASAKKTKRLNQSLSRKKNGSKNKEKIREQFQTVHAKIKNARKDFLHKLSSKLIDENQVIVCEDLQVKNLMKKCKPKKDEDGSFAPNGQAAKRGMNHSFADAGLGMFVGMLQYKAERSGRTLLKVPAHFTSKTCNACGSINSELKLSDRAWICSDCGTEHERDHNAAKNVLAKGMKILSEINQTGGGTRLLHLENGSESFGDIPEGLGAEEPNHRVTERWRGHEESTEVRGRMSKKIKLLSV